MYFPLLVVDRKRSKKMALSTGCQGAGPGWLETCADKSGAENGGVIWWWEQQMKMVSDEILIF